MNSHGLTRENLVATLPVALRKDESAVALAESIADLLARRPEEIDLLRIYPEIDRLDGQLLDILANDFKVDWWDPNYSLAEKRKVFRDSWYVHKHMGTKAAVEKAIQAVYPGATVEEWFEYGGKPYHFRLWINLTDDDVDSERMRRVMDRLMFYKSLRSHNDEIFYFTELGTMPQVQGSVLCAGCHCGLDADVPAEKKPTPSYHAQTGAAIAAIALEAAISKKIHTHTDIPEYQAGTQVGVGVGTICMSMDVFI